MNLKKKFMLILFLLILIPLVQGSDEEARISCGGDEEIRINCNFGMEETGIEAEEEVTPIVTPPVVGGGVINLGCGDNICSPGIGETAENCPEDCDTTAQIEQLIEDKPLGGLVDVTNWWCSLFLKLLNFIAQLIRNVFLYLQSVIYGTDAPHKIIPNWDAMPECKVLKSLTWLIESFQRITDVIRTTIYGVT